MRDNDSSLVKRLQDPATQQAAFSELAGQYSEQLYWQIRRMVVWHDDADDVLQNVLIKAWTGIGSFRGQSKLSTWLYTIAMREALDFLRSKASRDAHVGEGDAEKIADRLAADRYFDGDKAQILLQQAIATLPDVQRAVFNMRYYDELKYKDMSQILGTSEGALKASYHIAMTKITDYVKRHG